MAKRKPKLLGSHQKCWLWGRHVVGETLRAGHWRPLELLLADSLDAETRTEFEKRAKDCGVPVKRETSARLRQLCKSDDHQGCLARMPEFPYADAERMIAEKADSPAFVLLEGLQDPHNLGAILRSAEVFGIDGVFLRATGQVGVTSLVARTSAGAVNHLPIARVPYLSELIRRLQSRELHVLATHPAASTVISQVDLRRPTAIVIGSEAHGVTESTRALCDMTVAIPQAGSLGSLNAAVAAGVVFYELSRQRGSVNSPLRAR